MSVDLYTEAMRTEPKKIDLGLKELLSEYKIDIISKELDMQILYHALECNKKCGGKNDSFCETNEFLIGYRKAFKEENK